MEEINTIVIAGFPGVGKSYLYNLRKDLKILDSDSSKYSWISPGVRNSNFPDNYMIHIEENLGKADIILTSTHDVVRRALDQHKIKFYLVYPSSDLLNEYVERYKRRGNDVAFITLMQDKWNIFIDECKNFKSSYCTKIELQKSQHLKDILHLIKIKTYKI